MRLIDADEYKRYLDKYWIPANYEAIDIQPTIDAVKVVLCKDCNHSSTYGDEENNYWCNNPAGLYGDVVDNYFCCKGERRNS